MGFFTMAWFFTLGFTLDRFILGTMASPVSTQSASGLDSLAARAWPPSLLSPGISLGLGTEFTGTSTGVELWGTTWG